MNYLKIKNKVKNIFIKFKLNNKHATLCAEYLIKAELVGAPSHGIARLKCIVKELKKK